jgi:hypothetical protein
MQYSINLSQESDHLLRQLCDSGKLSSSEGISPEAFLSAFVEEQLGELFLRRERREAGQTNSAVRSAKECAKTWSEAVVATHTALEAMRKLVKEVNSNSQTDLGGRSRP